MPQASVVQSNFSGGEFGKRFQGRIDAERHPTGLALCENWIVPLQGCAYRRPGTEFIAFAGDQIAPCYLVPFEFSTTQAYVLEFGHLYIRFYRNGDQIDATRTITGITKANPAVVTSTGHGFVNGQTVTISGVGGMTQVNGLSFIVAGATANTYQLSGVNSTAYGTYTSGGTATGIYTLDAPYVDVDLFEIRYAQSLDVLYLVHPLYAPRKLTRTAHDAWTLTTIDFQDGPFLDENITAVTITPSATTGAITLTASSATFTADMVGRLVRIEQTAQSGCAKITAFTSTTVVSATVQTGFAFLNTTASTKWRLGVWCPATGYPATVVFFQNRLVFAGTYAFPLRVDLSMLSKYETFSPKVPLTGVIGDDNAIALDLQSNDVQDIRWVSPDSKVLLLGTGTGEWAMSASTPGDIVSPSDCNVHQEGADGSALVAPLRIGNATVYLQRAGRKLKDLRFYFDQDGFRGEDLTYIADHATESGIRQIAFMREPDPIVWCVREDGQLAGMTYSRSLDSLRVAWHRHILGGVSTDGGAPAKVRSCAVIPASGGGYELWLQVQRYVNDQVVYHIERMTPVFEQDSQQHNAFFVDAGLRRTDIFDVFTVVGLSPVSVYTAQAHGFANGDRVFLVELEGPDDLNSKIYTVQGISATVTITIASPGVVTWAAHQLFDGDPVRLSTTGALPTGLTAGTVYYVKSPATNTLQLAATPGGAAINTSGIQSGVHTMTATSRLQLYEGASAVDGTALPSWQQGGRVARLVSSLTGLTHLRGLDVQVLGDGGVQEATVSNDTAGTITVDPTAGFVVAGLGYKSDLQTLRIEGGSLDGPALGKHQRIDYVSLFLDNAGGLKAGRDFDHLEPVLYRNTDDPIGIAPPLFSGIQALQYEPDPSTDSRVCIRHDEPLPATLLGIIAQVQTNDRSAE